MNKLLLSNIRKSFEMILSKVIMITDDIVIDKVEKLEESNMKGRNKVNANIESEEDKRLPPFDIVRALNRIAFRPIPCFYKDKSKEWISPQKSFFGFYAARNALRYILIGLRYIQAGDKLTDDGFLASSTLLYYTASFHLLNSFYSLQGRVIVDIFLKAAKNDEKSSTLFQMDDFEFPSAFIARITASNDWKFEKIERTHIKIWKELIPIILSYHDDIPEFFLKFFSYIANHNFKPEDMNEKTIGNIIKRIIEIRHESVYMGYGYDDVVHDAVLNRDTYSGFGIDRRSKEYRTFALGLLDSILKGIMVLISSIAIEYWEKIRWLIAVSITTPPFERGSLDLVGETKMTTDLKYVFEVLLEMQ